MMNKIVLYFLDSGYNAELFQNLVTCKAMFQLYSRRLRPQLYLVQRQISVIREHPNFSSSF
jgi:hypothetical protein